MPKSDSLGQFEQLVLTAVVTLGDNAYGVSIHRKVTDLLAPKSVTLAAVYVTLERLERKGHLSSWLSEPTAERGGRTKRCYAMEASGERALKDAMTAARRMAAAVAPVWGVLTNTVGKA